jgi:hypothetical protein
MGSEVVDGPDFPTPTEALVYCHFNRLALSRIYLPGGDEDTREGCQHQLTPTNLISAISWSI